MTTQTPYVNPARAGEPLEEAITRLQTEAESRVDAVVDTRNVRAVVRDGEIVLVFATADDAPDLSGYPVTLTDYAAKKFARSLGIGSRYWGKLAEREHPAPYVLADNVNYWLQHDAKRRLFRTVGTAAEYRALCEDPIAPQLRAMLSDRYLPVDNLDFLNAVLEGAEPFDARPKCIHVTSERLMIQFETPVERENPARKGDILRQGLTVKNSEVGDGSVIVRPWVLRLVCANGMTIPQKFNRRHLGGKLDVGMLEQDTLDATAEAILKMVRDHTAYALNPEHFDEIVDRLAVSSEVHISGSEKLAAASVVKRFGLSKNEGSKILDRLRAAGDPTQYGLANAVTRVAQESESFERAVELETAGGEIAFWEAEPFWKTTNPARGMAEKEVAKLLGL